MNGILNLKTDKLGSSSSKAKSESVSLKIPTSSPAQQGKTNVPTIRISAPTNTQHPLNQSLTST
ncbi:11448_t:CDS:2 [Racocetra persica]|uniref:11448_t:CDS:1 n=1 Tax=Racocetra persica TaxID=160502 RepID=A0ACA9NMN8_9GLOM|nr:11448_t:CDS:2 [Racocetra persica]